MREIFETDNDKIRQEKTANILAAAWKCNLVPTSNLSRYDFKAYRNNILKAIIEIKWRLNRKANDFGGITFLNLHKKMDLIEEANNLNCEPIFVWHFQDQIRYINVRKTNFTIEKRGREDRDGLDIRSALRIPIPNTKIVINKNYETN